MINLNTCVKGQKLRLRKGRIVTYVHNDRSSTFPHKTRTEEGHYVSYLCDGTYSGGSGLDVVEILPLETTDKHPSIAWWESCPWITDRKPKKEDGDDKGWVIVKSVDILTAGWATVKAGDPWVHRPHWQPPALTDREQALQLINNHEDGWRPTPEQWNVIRAGLKAS